MAEQTKKAFERVQMARHPDRPYTKDLLSAVFTDFVELHGDRRYADDAAIVGGFARIEKIEVLVIGQQKGRDITQRQHRNFGMPKPEGYRKALRLMKLAEKFNRPIITFIDTPGAYPGIDAEERGQAEAIAYNLREMANLKVPTIVIILGEGGSGGALAIGVGDRVLMLENSVYSVITPEGCAAILWKDKDVSRSSQAAECLRLTADDLKKFALIDEIIPEKGIWKYPSEDNLGDQKSFEESALKIKKIILRHLNELNALKTSERMDLRFQKFRNMGSWTT
jgi:acetyl-CoA carboxylase carboxyl transferase subunit alpha